MGELVTYAEFNYRRRQKKKRRGLLEILEDNLVHIEDAPSLRKDVQPVSETLPRKREAGTVVEFRTPQRLRPFQR